MEKEKTIKKTIDKHFGRLLVKKYWKITADGTIVFKISSPKLSKILKNYTTITVTLFNGEFLFLVSTDRSKYEYEYKLNNKQKEFLFKSILKKYDMLKRHSFFLLEEGELDLYEKQIKLYINKNYI